jgi:F420-non-reducing hydrogenase small subunit
MSNQPTASQSPAAETTAPEKAKGKLALYWAASCGGCEIAVLAINEKILDVAAAFDIVFWPVAVDAKVHDVENMPDGFIDVCLFNGSIRTSEQEYMAQLLRKKSKVLVAFGSCAHEGCIPGLANMNNREEVFQTVYHQSPSTDNPQGIRPEPKTEVPEGTLHLPVFYDSVRTLGQTVPVDYFLPGCPPEADRIWDAVVAILEGNLPAPGSVIGSDTTVCDECKRTRSEKKITEFKRTWEVIPDSETCLLEQGLICCGIATRAGCGARCPEVNSPCIGCYGPNNDVKDYGVRLMTALASVIDSNDPDEVDRIIEEGIPDPIGSFYRFSLAASLLRRKKLGNGDAAGNP